MDEVNNVENTNNFSNTTNGFKGLTITIIE